jgi:nitroreductase
MIKDLIKKNRTCRKFYEDFKIERNTLEELVNLARLSASAGNMQPLKYILSCKKEKNSLIFPTLAWAQYFKDWWKGPGEGERPSAYIIMLADTEINKNYWCDPGIAAQSILLGATEKGLLGCIIASVRREELRSTLKIDKKYEILYVLAIGKPKENILLEKIEPDGNIKYWRDSQGVHHVPKRTLKEVIID